jgi:hypothetical protein
MLDSREARGCGSAQTSKASPSPRLAFVVLSLSLVCCEHLIGIDEHDFRNAQAGTTGAGAGGQDGQSGGRAPETAGGTSAAAGTGNPQAGEAGAPQLGVGGHSGLGGRGGTGAQGTDHGGGGAFDDVLPRVVSHAPDGSKLGVDADEQIRIEFSEAMAPLSVETAYTQSPGRPTHFAWSRGNTVLTVSPGLERPTSVWTDRDRPGEPSDLVVTYGLDARAQDEAGNPLASALAATYRLNRRVQHLVNPCFELSGTASASAFEAAAPMSDTPCVTSADDPLTMKIGDSNGAAVAAVLSFGLEDLPPAVALVGATIALSFDEPVGVPHALHGTLWLEEIAAGRELSNALDAPSLLSLGVLTESDDVYPATLRKQASESVARVLELAQPDGLLQFRVQFDGTIEDTNLSPDYVRLGGTTEPPALWLSYDCAACP